MSENKNSVLPDVIEPISNAIQHNIPETARQADGALSTVVGFFNNVVLYPVKKANLTFRYKLEAFEDDLKEKIKNIPEENLQVPPVKIAGPVLEALRYAYDEAELREMYEEMLATAMDNRKAQQVHRSYVDAVRQMEPLDAQVLRRISNYNQIATSHVKLYLAESQQQYYINAMPYHYNDALCDLGDPFQISASISNLLRLGLLISTPGFLNEGVAEKIEKEPYVQKRFELYSRLQGGARINVSGDCDIISIDSYGRYFIDVCMPKKEIENNAD